MRQNWEEVNQPSLYKNTYWGQNRYDDNNSSIIENRNYFATQMGLTQCVYNKRPAYIFDEIDALTPLRCNDHIEVYRTDDAYVILASPYTPAVEDKRAVLDLGWYEVVPLYSPHATTFVKVIPLRTRAL